MAKLTPEQMDYYETEMRRLENNDIASKWELRLFMQSPMACGHAVGNLLTCDSPPEGCVICNEIDRLTAKLKAKDEEIKDLKLHIKGLESANEMWVEKERRGD